MDIFGVISNLSPLGWGILTIAFVIVLELIFTTIVRTTKKKYDETLLSVVLSWKIGAGFFSFAIFICGIFLLQFLDEFLLAFGIVGLIALYIASNYWFVKTFGKFETEDEMYERLSENSKFKRGDLVRIKKFNKSVQSFRSNNPDSESFIRIKSGEKRVGGKTFVVNSYDSDGDIKAEFNLNGKKTLFVFSDNMLSLVKKASNKTKNKRGK